MSYRIVTLPDKPHIHYHYVEQGSPEWDALREGCFSGSNAYKLLTPMGESIYAQAAASGFGGNFWTKRGHILEDESVELVETITGLELERVGIITNDKYPGCIYSPDAVIPARVLYEMKSFDVPQHMKLINGDIDVKILAQIYYGRVITELPDSYLVPYNPTVEDPGKALKIIPIPANDKIEANFKRILQKVTVAA